MDEAARLDAMRFVNPGAIIGFRRQGVEAQDICFGQVISCDTIRRQWHVKLESVENDFEVVQESMIACIEDLTKRTTILACTPAPESSGSLETFFNATSIGHLILSLRWCCQFYSELLRNNSIPSEFMSSTVRLAELLSSLLGTEISIGEEIRKKQTPSQFHLDVVLANQLLDLFGDLSDFGEYVEYSSGEIQRDGRLKKILTSKGWNTVRNQLGDFLSLAVTRSRMINSNPSSRNW